MVKPIRFTSADRNQNHRASVDGQGTSMPDARSFVHQSIRRSIVCGEPIESTPRCSQQKAIMRSCNVW
jgi:hypothetical protein